MQLVHDLFESGEYPEFLSIGVLIFFAKTTSILEKYSKKIEILDHKPPGFARIARELIPQYS